MEDEHILNPSKKSEFEKILKNAGPNRVVIVDFFAPWCGACRLMMPKFHKLANEFHELITFVKADVEDLESVAQVYDIQMMPSFVFVKDGKQINIIEGNKPDDLRSAVEKIASGQ